MTCRKPHMIQHLDVFIWPFLVYKENKSALWSSLPIRPAGQSTKSSNTCLGVCDQKSPWKSSANARSNGTCSIAMVNLPESKSWKCAWKLSIHVSVCHEMSRFHSKSIPISLTSHCCNMRQFAAPNLGSPGSFLAYPSNSSLLLLQVV